MDGSRIRQLEELIDTVGFGNGILNSTFNGSDRLNASGTEQASRGPETSPSGASRRSMLKLISASAGIATIGTGVASASDGHQLRQVPKPSGLCGSAPSDHHLALIERNEHERGRGFYSGTSSSRWAFTGWLSQTRPEETASGTVTPAKDATETTHRLIQVYRPEDLKQYVPGDHDFALIEDESHEKGRGFYTGGNGKWYFVGWLEQSRPAETTSGSISPKKDSDRSDERLVQVMKPKHLNKHDPSDHHLAFIEDESHEKGRGFYSGSSDGNWYFIGWLAQSPPSGETSDVLDPSSGDCGSDDSGDGDSENDRSNSDVFDPGTVSNGAWRWYAEQFGPYESWFDEEAQAASVGHGKRKWHNFVDFDTRDFPEWVANGKNRIFLPHIPMLPNEEVDDVGQATALRDLAAGEHNDRFREMAENFAADGFTSETLVLRIGNEFNIEAAPYSPVGTDVSPETWAEGYRQVVESCREVLGDDLETVWAPLVHSAQMPTSEVLAHYPGAEYAIVGADIYDSAPAYEKPAQAPGGIDYDTASDTDRKTVQEYVWEENHRRGNKWGNDGVGLDDIADLATDVNSPIAIPEWGLSNDEEEWGGDVNPTFVQKMYDWMQDHEVLFHAYFEHDTPGTAHELADAGEFDFGAAAERYRGTFGGASTDFDDGGNTDDGTETTSSNYVFVTESELQTQKQRVDNGQQPWEDAYDDLISDAKAALSTTLRSVTDDGGDHRFKQTTDRDDYLNAIRMSEWARDCGLAYQFTGEDRYAERTVEILHHWCLADDTYMEPTTDIVNNKTTIEQHITIPALMYAAALVRGHAAWNNYDGSRPWDGGDSPDAESALQQWVSDRHDTFTASEPYPDSDLCEYNNKWAWRIADRTVSAAYLQDDARMETARCMWKGQCRTCDDGKQRPWNDFVNNYRDGRSYDGSADPNRNGVFTHELHRSGAFGYSAYNLKAMMMSLLVFERYDDTQLYDYNAPSDRKSGSSLWKAFNWLEEYTEDTSAWSWNDERLAGSSVEESTSTFELAYAHWGEFKGAIDNPSEISGRPHYDIRLLGHVTLTHGAE